MLREGEKSLLALRDRTIGPTFPANLPLEGSNYAIDHGRRALLLRAQSYPSIRVCSLLLLPSLDTEFANKSLEPILDRGPLVNFSAGECLLRPLSVN